MDSNDLPELDRFFAAERERHLAELADFLRIPSVSALPAHRDDMARAAEWVAEQLRSAGVPQVEVLPTAGHPVVWGAWPGAEPGAPTALIYGHYDTQPADPLELWETPPFEPTVREGRLYARGASDDKGNLLIPIKVVEAYRATGGRPPLGLVFLFEGEEEIGSPNLRPFLGAHWDRLRADVAISADSAMWSHEQPSLVLATKGLAGVQLDVPGATGDLHSGLHGGMAPNPLNALASLLASMRTPEGAITIEGFYDSVRPLTDKERGEIAAVPFDEAAYMESLGVNALVGEPGFSPLERNWARPTLDVNGLWGGFQGEGSKTVIPATAGAKITCRLVPNQDPARVIAAIERHVRDHCPPGVTVTVTPVAGTARAYAIPREHPALLAVRDALRASYDREPLAIRLGGTLPITEFFKADLGLDTVGLAWEMPDENLHGPNEFLRLENFDRGLRVYADVFRRLAGAGRGEAARRGGTGTAHQFAGARAGSGRRTISTRSPTTQPELDWPGTLVSTDWLAAHLGHPALRIVDMRGYVETTDLGGGKQGARYLGARDEYDTGHIPGAVYVDWTSDIVDPDDPVPAQIAPPERFAALMGRLGIGDDTFVVLYDHKGQQFATRGWWALAYYGHDRAAVLDGGWAKWTAEGRPVGTDAPQFPLATFAPTPRPELRATAAEVLARSRAGDATIIDARDRGQYTGAIVRGDQGGHIPGARHLPSASLFNPDGTWKRDDELRQIIAAAGLAGEIEPTGPPVIAYCNGGVAATTVLFALDRLGREGANYDGSWNEWGRTPKLPTRRGDEP